MKANFWGGTPTALTNTLSTPQGRGKTQGEQGSDEGHSPGSGQGQGQPRKRNPYESKTASAPGGTEVSFEELQRAVASFEKEATGQTHGVHAAIESIGDPPGLRVVLRDTEGQVLRRLSPTEFVKLRAQASGDRGMPGKVLDQKI